MPIFHVKRYVEFCDVVPVHGAKTMQEAIEMAHKKPIDLAVMEEVPDSINSDETTDVQIEYQEKDTIKFYLDNHPHAVGYGIIESNFSHDTYNVILISDCKEHRKGDKILVCKDEIVEEGI